MQFSELDLKASKEYDGSDEAKEKEYKSQYGCYKTLYTIIQTANEAEDISVSGITFWGTAIIIPGCRAAPMWAAVQRGICPSVPCCSMRIIRLSRVFMLLRKRNFNRLSF